MDATIGIQVFGQYDAARRALERLLEEFEAAADGPEPYPPLGHQLISPLCGPLTGQQWSAFISANTKQQGDWQRWDAFPGGQSCGRLFGQKDSLSRFIEMADTGMALLRTIKATQDDGTAVLPEGLVLRLPTGEAGQGWLQLLYETARAYPTPFLSADPGFWACTGQLDCEEEAVWETTPDGIRYPVHPFFEELRPNLFEASAEAIRLWLDPSQAISVGDRISDGPPVRLPPEPERNGPCPPNEFWLWGKRHELSPKPWLLLEFLWGKEWVRKEDAMRYVYGGTDDAESAFKSLVKRLQGEIANNDCPAEVHTKKEHIRLICFKPCPAPERPAQQAGVVEPNV
jgi:hypothetical protein